MIACTGNSSGMKKNSSTDSRGQLPSRSFSTVRRRTRHPKFLQVRRNSWPFSYDVMQRMVMGRGSGKKPPSGCFVTKTEWMQGKRDESGPQFSGWKEELQERTDARRPGIFIVLAIRNQFEMQIVIILPAAVHERVAERRNILNGARALLGASIE